ncbi:MOSC domain-containing protein [Gaetbulibacter saemankumensis]|uniref:MOSC domain-containing protein n=1 Tax=Gaetbulibacter saemankumensis TaxID=311208 RepID=UPI000428EB98|nr:MOSC domain-containing protein [Gaetbulibacter saemankumensis]
MKVVSTNISQPKTIIWNNKKLTTGIYKTPDINGIYLDKNAVKHDEVSDKKVHGGEFKACYLFSKSNYEYWRNLYPNLDWNNGMFGENITIDHMDETQIHIGDIYKLGETLVQITQPREPCYKLGIKFESQEVLQQFINHSKPGTYVKVLEPGSVKTGDTFTLIKSAESSISIADFFKLLYAEIKNKHLIAKIINNEALPLKKRKSLERYL